MGVPENLLRAVWEPFFKSCWEAANNSENQFQLLFGCLLLVLRKAAEDKPET